MTSLSVKLEGEGIGDERTVVFGLREIGVEGTQFTLNGQKIFLRGTHEGCSFPLTGHPPMDAESWKRIFRICREYGLNHMRFHSWCPPEAAFAAADELGFYLQPECSIWARDKRRLYAACTGAALRPELGPVTGTQFLDIGRIGSNLVRGQTGWNGNDYRKTVQGADVPIITHELGQHAVFPNFDEMKKYTGLLKPRNFEFFRESMKEHGMMNPALALFPTDFHSDWQWESLIKPGCRAIDLDGLSPRLKPIVQAIDDYNRNNRQGLVFECHIGKGKLLVCAFDLTADAATSPVKRQFISSLLLYMAGKHFNPSVEATPGQIASLFFDNKIMSKLQTKAVADAESPGSGAANLVDGNPVTAWLTPSRGEVKGFPHQVTVTFEKPISIAGVVFINQQRDRKRIGEIKEYVIEAGTDGQNLVEVRRGSLESAFSPQRIFFSNPIQTDRIRFTALSSFDRGSVATMAEMAVIVGETKSVRSDKKQDEGIREKQIHPDEIDGNMGGPPSP